MQFKTIALLLACWLSAVSGAEKERVIGIGSAIIDLLVQVDDDFLTQHVQRKKGGGYLLEKEIFAEILKKLPPGIKITPGGSAGNTIRALSKLGLSCSHLCYVGADTYGELFASKTALLGIDGVQQDPNETTFCILCLITPDGERTFLHATIPSDRDVIPAKIFENAKWVHFEGYIVWEAPRYFEKCLQAANEAGAAVSLCLGNFSLIKEHKESLLKYLEDYVDMVFGNEEELNVLTGLSALEGCKKLQEICQIAVVTRGSDSCLIGSEGTITEVSSFPTKPIDTTGAGDYFSAGFIYGYINGFPLAECARFGHRMASSVIEHIGTDLPDDRWREIHSSLQ